MKTPTFIYFGHKSAIWVGLGSGIAMQCQLVRLDWGWRVHLKHDSLTPMTDKMVQAVAWAQPGLLAKGLPSSPLGPLCKVCWASSQHGDWVSGEIVSRQRKWKLAIYYGLLCKMAQYGFCSIVKSLHKFTGMRQGPCSFLGAVSKNL